MAGLLTHAPKVLHGYPHPNEMKYEEKKSCTKINHQNHLGS